MAVLRTDIERALNDLISNEAGMKFQGLAAILARRRWPDLIPSERKSDLGADAIAKPPFAAEGGGKVLACSTTASLEKVRKDAKRIKDNFAGISKLIFATPDTVSNKRAEEWAAEIHKDFGYELAVMEREEFITSLMDPLNASLLEPFLGLAATVEPDIRERLARARAASSDIAAAWTRQMSVRFLVRLRALRLERDGKDTNEILDVGLIGQVLERSGRLVLEGPAGRGKTTTLLQIAHHHQASGTIAILISLPDWAASGMPILDFIAGMPQFLSAGLNAEGLMHVINAQHVSFLLNGWNEIGEAEFGRAERLLRGLERDFPTVGIIVATRTHHIIPPLPGAMRARLLPLTRSERTVYLYARLASKADSLRQTIETDSALDALTRTPFILSEVASLFEAGVPIPSTKLGVLAAVTRLAEENDEHRNPLQQAPLRGHAQIYLAEMARQMTARGGVSLLDKDARLAVFAAWENLKAQGQTFTPIEPMDVLATLCAHHVLERRDYPATAFQFEHQQFQEYYASLGLEAELRRAYESGQDADKSAFAKTYLNEPGWAEPLRMIAGQLGSDATLDAGATDIGAFLIKTALPLDSVFAGDLARLCGPRVWAQVKTAVGERLRALYAVPERQYREVALTGMLATGSDDFTDIIVPLLSGANPQEGLGSYRAWGEFHLSCLGANWSQTVSQWNEPARAAFVTELIRRRSAPEIAAFVHADPSLRVKLAAINAFAWVGAEDEAANLFASLDDEVLGENIGEIHLDLLPPASHPRAVTALRRVLDEQTEPNARLATLLNLSEFGGGGLGPEIKDTLSKLPNQLNDHQQWLVQSALALLGPSNKDWISAWVAERIASSNFWREQSAGYITTIPEELRQQLVARMEGENIEQVRRGNPAGVLTAVADAAMAQRLFRRLCAVRKEMLDAPKQRHELAFAIQRQIVSFLRGLPPDLTARAVLNELTSESALVEMDAVCHVFSNVGYPEYDLGGRLDTALSERLRAYVSGAIEVALNQDDFSGELKGHLASILSMIGSPADMPDLDRLIRADLERSREGRAAWAAGDRTSRGNGGLTTNAGVYLKAVLRLDSGNADALLVALLEEPEYERDACEYLIRQMAIPKAEGGHFQKADYARIWRARELAGNLPNRERRAYFAAAMKTRIDTVMTECTAAAQRKQKQPLEYRLRQLAGALAAIDGHGFLELVLDIQSLPNEFDNYSVANTIETLLFNGVQIPAARAIPLLDATLERIRKHGMQQQDTWLALRILSLLPFLGPAQSGIEALRRIVAEFRFDRYWEFRDVLQALGCCRCEEALQFLKEIGADKDHLNRHGEAWLDAVASINTRPAHDLLLGFIDPDLAGLPNGIAFNRDDHLAARIADIASADPQAKGRLIQLSVTDLPQGRRLLLSKILCRFADLDAVMAGLNLIDDAASPSVPFEILQQLEGVFVERRPAGSSANAFTLEPRNSNAVRARLFEMALKDERRKRPAGRLLAQIEEWRLRYGRPTGEPRHPAPESGLSWPLLP
jgi:hypothetical protein